ncbi:AAA family ATPase [Candidatus Daviesbacteria bacterium]|nr:AAA family ATPase [Candidatus Daviesbacteria bacterium]
MDNVPAQDSVFANLKSQITQNHPPADLSEKLISQLDRLQKIFYSVGYRADLDKELEYIKFVSFLPFGKMSVDILDLHRAVEVLDHNHYGLKVVKDRVLEYLSMLILNTKAKQRLKSPVLFFVGLVGSGKTSLAYSIAESLGRQIIRIPFGGLGSTRELRGESKSRPEAEPGRILKLIHDLGVSNPVILLDEIDRVAQDSRSDIMGVLVELLDPEQNMAFVDYPFDLSNALFIATANNTSGIATAVLDRLEIIEMPAYSDEEKIMIGKNYMLPKLIKTAGLPSGILTIDENLWPQIVRPLGFDAGIRSLQRSVEGVVRKVARLVVEGHPGPYKITAENIGQYVG